MQDPVIIIITTECLQHYREVSCMLHTRALHTSTSCRKCPLLLLPSGSLFELFSLGFLDLRELSYLTQLASLEPVGNNKLSRMQRVNKSFVQNKSASSVIFHAFIVCCLFFILKPLFYKNYKKYQQSVIQFDPDQVWRFGLDQGPNCLQRLSADDLEGKELIASFA